MVKIKTISRSEDEYTRERPTELIKVHKNVDPIIHPFEKPREYVRALNAVKLERVFAKPFVGALQGHRDGVFCISKHPKSLSTILSGSCDGEIRVWNLSFKTTMWNVKAHSGFVRGLTVSPSGDTFLSCGDDKTIKLWNISNESKIVSGNKDEMERQTMEISTDISSDATKEPKNTWLGKFPFTSIDHQRKSNLFVTTAAQVVQLWDENRSNPIRTFEWGTDSVYSVAFNPVELDIFATCATDRSVALYDLRGNTPIRKLILAMKSNVVAWNPMEAFNFTVANEDHNLYTFDMRKLSHAIFVHKDHVSAVLSVDYSPTGKEFCSGSYDRSIRIFRSSDGKSREVYHARRMQRIFTAIFTADSRFVLSGSDDTNIRIWKANASEHLGVLTPRQKHSINYQRKLKERFKFVPEIRRIDRHRQIPKPIYKATKLRQLMAQSARRKEDNRRRHSRPGSVPFKAERSKQIIAEVE